MLFQFQNVNKTDLTCNTYHSLLSEKVSGNDIAFSLLNIMAMELVQTANLYAMTNDIRNICMAGNFIDNKLSRMLITEHASMRMIRTPSLCPLCFQRVVNKLKYVIVRYN